MAGEAARKLASYADIEALPEHLTGEIIRGELWVSPRPAKPHVLVLNVIASDLGSQFFRGRGGPGGWIILSEPEIHLGENVFVPDIAGWRRERFTESLAGTYFVQAPDWVCEVLSPSTAAYDRVTKVPAYGGHGVQHIWLVDPEVKTLEVLRLDGASYRLVATFAGDKMVRAEPFDAIELELGALWRW